MSTILNHSSYDVIICGGGTAGCVLAARLTEDPNTTVLMLEAGEDANDDPRITTPALFASLYDDPQRDWMLLSEPSPGLHDRKLHHPRGKCIGGSSAINLMAMVYPSKTGLDTWAELGNPGWDWKSMAPYFRKFQTHVKPSKNVEEALGIDYLDGEFTGTDGPIKASFPQTLDPLQKAWIDSWKTLQRSGNPIDGVGNGGFAVPASIDVETGRRSFAGTEYWGPVKGRGNLQTVTGALVERVELEEKGSGGVEATGVVFSVAGERYVAKARSEVILCAGVFGSPQILELSGIGSAELCKSLGIKNVIDNPNVGENLQDHLMAGPSWEVNDTVQTADQFRDPSVIQSAMEKYQTTSRGPLANGGGHQFAYCPLVDFITPEPKETLSELLSKHLPSSTSSSKKEEVHNAYIRKIISSPDETPLAMCMITVQFHGDRENVKDKMSLLAPENYITCLTQLSHPFSRGNTHITSASASVKPLIKPNYLSHPLDAEILGRGILQAEYLSTVEPLRSFLKSGGKRLPDDRKIDSLEEAIEFGRSCATSNYHPCGTCTMMPVELGGVVNERLVVHGTRNLRVVDASVFPIEPRGNIMTSVYAAAEKGAEMIGEDLRRG
ncbi:hypothetical protein PRZ48_001005 [Zasmidium cellare]|uniref:Glucose-methanol-choline oxidoreductase N-terminal domain-containing protein n=1 Tax=Zasmidium cellare TaxID=395010 RepID=A0ABR0F1U4_ZASCE|nr:hypothetical protein PRZ48_001005 [Zasmidium cellare]